MLNFSQTSIHHTFVRKSFDFEFKNNIVSFRLLHPNSSPIHSTKMKQNLNAILPPRSEKFSAPVSTEERLEVLLKSTKEAPLKHKEKRDLFISFIPLMNSIFDKASIFDGLNNSSMKESLQRILPTSRSQIKAKKNKELAEAFLELVDPFELLHTHLSDQHKALIEASLNLCSKKHQSKDAVLLMLENFLLSIQKIDEFAMSLRHSNVDPSLKNVTLTNSQKQRCWKKERVPVNEGLQFCVECGHKSTNFPIENDEYKAHNDEVEKNYLQKLKEWNKYEAKRAKDPSARKPAGMNRKPQRGKIMHPMIQCMCSTSSCMMEGRDISSSCPVKCCDPITQQRFPYTGTGSDRHCSFPICKCQCSFYCVIDDIPKYETNVRAIRVATDDSNEVKAPGEASCAFLASVLQSAVKSGFEDMKNDYSRETAASNLGKKSSQNVHQNIMHRTQNAICEKAGVDIVKTGNQLLSLEEKHYLRQQIGRPSTKVQLPNGTEFDTRYIMANGQHGNNNRLGDSVTKAVHAGMKSNLKIDLSGATDKFIQAAAKCQSNALDIGSFSSVEVIERPKDDGNSSLSSIEVIDPKEAKIEAMHKRVLVRSRNDLTTCIQKRRKGDSDELRSRCKSIKKMIGKLEQSEHDGTHLNIIKQGVTNDGHLLLESPGLNSQDLLEMLDLYHDD